MPIGNGDIGANVWVEQDGDLVFYVSETDAWSENGRLLKLGRVRIRLSPNPFGYGVRFRQELRLGNGEIIIQGGAALQHVVLRVWVDANHPALIVEGEADSPTEVRVALELWRNQRRALRKTEVHSAYGLHGNSAYRVFVEPDTVVGRQDKRIVWYHRNGRSIWADNLKLQALGGWRKRSRDPLLDRTFGAAIKGTGLASAGDRGLRSVEPLKHFVLAVYPLTAQTDSAETWLNRLEESVRAVDAIPMQKRRPAHRDWWRSFWDRSWIRVSGSREAEMLTLGHTLVRYINACGGRGAMPIKFNGSIFNVDTVRKDGDVPAGLDADFRRWGGAYWFQNTRQIYWPMLANGDFDLMLPLFRMYVDALPLAKERTRVYYDHEGAFFPETMYFWGAYVNENYGWDRRGKPDGLTDNRYIRYYWQGGIELAAMMLDHYAYTGDHAFARDALLPLADEIVTFFDQHWKRDGAGKIRFEPAQALETLWDVVNPVPEIAGLTRVLNGMLALPDDMSTEAQRRRWTRTLRDLPALPIRADRDGTYLASAEIIRADASNKENVSLYATFPYRLFRVGTEGLKMMRHTYARRDHKGVYRCWANDNVFAAWLGLASEARIQLAKRFLLHDHYRFPVMYTRGDWPPDLDNGGVAQQALQAMLMQADGREIRLFPAWPKEWNVCFKLRAPLATTVEGKCRGGKLTDLNVTPESRSKDVIVMRPQ